MKLTFTLLILLSTLFFTGCVSRAYLLSPFTTISNSYHARPMVSDSISSLTYANAALSAGGANERGSDNTYSLQLGFHRSHTSQHLQAFYGVTGTMGLYDVEGYDTAITNRDASYYRLIKVDAINQGRGVNYFGGVMFNGGVNVVVPLSHGSEWRILGVEAAWGKEWGDYLAFRKNLPDSAGSAIFRDDRFGNICLTTEWAFKYRHKNSFGVKLAMGHSFYGNPLIYDNEKHYLRPRYGAVTVQWTTRKYILFGKLHGADHAYGGQVGINYKLGKGTRRTTRTADVASLQRL